jgi:hypothetical protein
MALFDQLFAAAGDVGFFGFFLPFLLVFAIIYGLLTKTQIFGKGRPVATINAIIALVAAFYVAAYTPVGDTIAGFLGRYFTQTTIVFLGFFVVMMALFIVQPFWPRKLVGQNPQTGKPIYEEAGYGMLGKYAGIAIILLLIGVFINSGGLAMLGLGQVLGGGGSVIPGISLSSQDIVIILFIIVTVGLIWWVTGGTGGGKKEE